MTYGSAVKFSRTFIYPSDVLPTDAFTTQVNSVIWRCKREEIYTFLLEEILLPRLNIISDLVPKVVSVAWSPQGMLHPCRCLLGMISSAGAVDILLEDNHEWFSVCDLQSYWLRNVIQGFPESYSMVSSQELRSHIRRLQAVAITWSDMETSMEESYSYFVVAYRSSDIIVWRIPAVMDHSLEVIPTVALRTNLNISVKIDVLEWISISNKKSLVVIGFSNGKIYGLILEVSQGQISSTNIEIYTEEDLIKVSCIECILKSQKEVRLVVAKSTFLFVIHIDLDGKKLSHYCYRVPAFSITGLSIISENETLIYTQDGKLSLVKVENQKMTSQAITTDLPKTHAQFLGLANSWNKVLFATLTSPNSMYDHLVVREPSILHIFTLESPKYDPLKILENNETSSMFNYWDCLSAIGMKLHKSLIPVNSIKKIPYNFEYLPVYKLRVLMWLSVLSNVFENKKSLLDFSNVSEELIEIRSLISLYTASAYLISIAGKPQVTAQQRLSARFLRTYLEVYIAGEIDEEETPACGKSQRALQFSCKIEPSGPETCNLCKTTIVELPWKMEKCPSGHKLPRCAVTLLQITSVRYRCCPICKQIFHSSLDEDYPEGPKCLFCDVPVLYDSRVFGTADRDKKNFSQRKVLNFRGSEQEEGMEDDQEWKEK
ncbi:uncharacterized protein LOC117167060 isoform X2 [Belonocnema kinseyi]|nr:uncharacterized protein LOC117167060 isoform X2 [Belonocnema kinseyi]